MQIALRGQGEQTRARLDLEDYVDVIRDVLKMKKNLCLARRLNSLKKSHIRSKAGPIYIDVWPVSLSLFGPLLKMDRALKRSNVLFSSF